MSERADRIMTRFREYLRDRFGSTSTSRQIRALAEAVADEIDRALGEGSEEGTCSPD